MKIRRFGDYIENCIMIMTMQMFSLSCSQVLA